MPPRSPYDDPLPDWMTKKPAVHQVQATNIIERPLRRAEETDPLPATVTIEHNHHGLHWMVKTLLGIGIIYAVIGLILLAVAIGMVIAFLCGVTWIATGR